MKSKIDLCSLRDTLTHFVCMREILCKDQGTWFGDCNCVILVNLLMNYSWKLCVGTTTYFELELMELTCENWSMKW